MNDPAGAITGVSVDQVGIASTTGTAVSLSDINGQAIIPGGGTGVSVRSGSAGKTSTATTTFSILNNTINDGGANAFDTVGIFVAKGQDLGTMSGTIQGNTLVGKTGSNSDGIPDRTRMAFSFARPAMARSPH